MLPVTVPSEWLLRGGRGTVVDTDERVRRVPRVSETVRIAK